MLEDVLSADLVAAARLGTVIRLRDGLEHELRSPLNSIVLNLELLKELIRSSGADALDGPLQRAEIIGRAVVRLQEGLSALWGELEAPVEETTVFSLSELFAELEDLVSAQLRQQRLGLDIELGEEGMPVRGRRGALRQAFLHLLVNAMRVSPRDRRIGFSARRRDTSFLVEVRDGGPGIEPHAQDRLFDFPYPNEDAGAGVGLFAARRLIEADGAELSLLASGPDGTTFMVRFPEASP